MTEARSTRDLMAAAIRESMWIGKDTPGELADAVLAVLGTEWGVQLSSHVKRVSEATAAIYASDGLPPVSRVVGAWQEANPEPPAGAP